MEQKFYICKHCGNIIAKVKDMGIIDVDLQQDERLTFWFRLPL